MIMYLQEDKDFQKLLNEVSHLNVHEVDEMFKAGDCVLLDVRTDEEYTSGHIARCIHLELSDIQQKDYSDFAKKAETIVCYCHSGRRSVFAAKALKDAGYNQVYSMNGGIIEWVQQGLQTIKS